MAQMIYRASVSQIEVGFDNFFTKSGSRTLDIVCRTRHRRWAVENNMQNALKSSGRRSQSEPRVPARLSLLGQPNRKRDRAGKQKALLQAALPLFATKGYEVTTTREIAAAAGCAEGLIHRYFKGKAGLLTALVEFHITDELVEMRHRPRSAVGLQEEFLQLIDWEIEYLWKNRDFLRIFISRALVDPSLGSVISQTVLSARTKAVMKRLQRHRQCAQLPQEELEVLAQSVGVFGMVFGFMRPVVLGQERTRARKMAATLAAMVVGGLR
jgi:TetR/AcrR family transcriptional regulator, regulator of cefoperazone and chloramphenicol sensitivity